MGVWHGRAAVTIVAVVVLLAGVEPATAQPPMAIEPAAASPVNTGALALTAGLDVPSVYVFRGIVQETDPSLTLSPYADAAVTFTRDADGRRGVGLNVGVWNSLQTGSSGTKGPSARLHYAENVYAMLSLSLPAQLTMAVGFTAYTSPNAMFNTIPEANLVVGRRGWLAPHALFAFELDRDGQADNGAKKGTYVELGVSPSFALGSRMRLVVPARLGLSGSNYYELAGRDRRFGFAEVGGDVTRQLADPGRFGTWTVHGGVAFYGFGETTKAFNRGKGTKVTGSVGVSVAY